MISLWIQVPFNRKVLWLDWLKVVMDITSVGNVFCRCQPPLLYTDHEQYGLGCGQWSPRLGTSHYENGCLQQTAPSY